MALLFPACAARWTAWALRRGQLVALRSRARHIRALPGAFLAPRLFFVCRETGGQPRGLLAASPAARELPQLSNPAWRQAEAASQGVGGFFRRRGLDRLQVPPLGARGDVQPLRAQIGLTDGRFYPQPDRRRNLGRRLAGDGEQLQEVIADHAAPARPRRWLPADRTPGALPAPGWPRQAGRRPGG